MCFKVRHCIFVVLLRLLARLLYLYLPLDGTIGLQSMCDLSSPTSTLLSVDSKDLAVMMFDFYIFL